MVIKFLTLFSFLLFSVNLLAQDPCRGQDTRKCNSYLGSAIMNRDYATFKSTYKKHGLEPFITLDNFQSYDVIRKAAFFRIDQIFEIMLTWPGYPEKFEKSRLMKDLFFGDEIIPGSPEVARLHLFNDNPSKRLTWYENPRWPYPYFNRLKEEVGKRKDKARYAGMFEYFDRIDAVKKNACAIKSVEMLESTLTEFPGIELLLAQDLLSCAIKEANLALATALLDKNIYDVKDLPSAYLNIGSMPINSQTLGLYKKISQHAKEHHLDLDKVNTDFTQLGNLKLDCPDGIEGLHFKNISALSDLHKHISYGLVLEDLRKAKTHLQNGERQEYLKILKSASRAFKSYDLELNLQDVNGRTLLHWVAEFVDIEGLNIVEEEINMTHNTFNYSIQDNDGNTPLHVALVNKNLSGALGLSDSYGLAGNGSFSMISPEVKKINNQGKTPLALIDEIKVNKEEKKLKKEIRNNIKHELDILNPRSSYHRE